MSTQPPQSAPGPYGAATQEHPQGTVILVLGILGFVTVICGVIAWILGAKAQKEIAASGTHYSNEGNIKIGKILGMVVTIIYAVIIVITIIAVIIASVAASSQM